MDLTIEAAALKALVKMPTADAAALRAKLKSFAADPYARHPWAKAFSAETGRIRQGDWRAIYRIEAGRMMVLVVKIGNRREIYR